MKNCTSQTACMLHHKDPHLYSLENNPGISLLNNSDQLWDEATVGPGRGRAVNGLLLFATSALVVISSATAVFYYFATRRENTSNTNAIGTVTTIAWPLVTSTGFLFSALQNSRGNKYESTREMILPEYEDSQPEEDHNSMVKYLFNEESYEEDLSETDLQSRGNNIINKQGLWSGHVGNYDYGSSEQVEKASHDTDTAATPTNSSTSASSEAPLSNSTSTNSSTLPSSSMSTNSDEPLTSSVPAVSTSSVPLPKEPARASWWKRALIYMFEGRVGEGVWKSGHIG